MPADKGPKPRHVPQRTCIGCRQEAGKRALARIVRTVEGRVALDSTGKANGRGAYVHNERECWEKALRGVTIDRALKISPSREDVEALRAYALGLTTQEG